MMASLMRKFCRYTIRYGEQRLWPRSKPAADASSELPDLLHLQETSRLVLFGRTQRRGSHCHSALSRSHTLTFDSSPTGNPSTSKTVTKDLANDSSSNDPADPVTSENLEPEVGPPTHIHISSRPQRGAARPDADPTSQIYAQQIYPRKHPRKRAGGPAQWRRHPRHQPSPR
jgi:hypothetical protein